MMRFRKADLSPWNDADDLIRTLGQIDDRQRNELLEAVTTLIGHSDPDVREEALRLLLVRWKVREMRHHAISALTERETPEMQALAAYGLAATSSEASRLQDVTALRAVLSDGNEDAHVRGAAYDALLIIFRKPAFPTMRTFCPDRDVDWEWVNALPSA